MILLTVGIHVGGFVALMKALQRWHLRKERVSMGTVFVLFALTIIVVFAIHAVEVWAWAALFVWLGEFETMSRALYFSTVTFTTVGYGDVVLGDDWKLLGSLEAANGVLLTGVSTAFLFAVLMRLVEHTDFLKPD